MSGNENALHQADFVWIKCAISDVARRMKDDIDADQFIPVHLDCLICSNPSLLSSHSRCSMICALIINHGSIPISCTGRLRCGSGCRHVLSLQLRVLLPKGLFVWVRSGR